MPLGSALKSTIDIDFTRAQGINSTGRITFEPPRTRVGTTVLSPVKISVPITNGLGSIELVRLPAGTYHVREEIDGQPPYEFNFSLPVSAPNTIQYEEIAPVDSVPLVYTVVRTINGVAPDPSTGNVVIETGAGATNLDALTDVVISSPSNAQSLVYDSLSAKWKNLLLTAADVGAAPTGHTHSYAVADIIGLTTALSGKSSTSHTHSVAVADVSGLTEALDGKAAALHGHAISDITGLSSALAGKASATHTHTSDDITDFDLAVETIADEVASFRALTDLIIRVKDKTKEGAGNTYDLPSTSGVWGLNAAIPMEYQIAAHVDDDISLDFDFLTDTRTAFAFDFVVVTGGTPTIQRYLSSGTSSPSSDGPSGSYPNSTERFQGMKGIVGFKVEAGDIDSGFVRLRWAIKSTAATGKIFANNNYPLSIRVVNIRLSGL